MLRELLGYGTLSDPLVWRPAVRLRVTLLTLLPVAFVTTVLLSKRLGLTGPGRMAFCRVRQGVVFLGLTHFYMALAVVTSRLSYPYELEWIEATTVDMVRWLQAGNTLWVAPTKQFAPLPYGPFFYYLQALLPIPQMGSIYLNVRWLSLGLTLGVMVCLYRLAVTWAPRVKEAGILALSIFSISFTLVGSWWDIPRTDMLFILLGLLGFYLCIECGTSWWSLTGAAALFALSGYTKQPAVLFMPGAAAVLLLRREKVKRIVFLIAGTVLVSVVLWGIEAFVSGGMVWRYSLDYLGSVPLHYNALLDRFFTYTLMKTQSLWFAILMIVMVLGTTLKQSFRNGEFLAAMGLLVVSTLLTAGMMIKASWYNASIPIVIGLAVFLPALVSFSSEASPSTGEGLRSPLAWVYLAIGVFALTNPYNPMTLIPTASDLKAGNELVEYLRSKKGPVFVPAHPTFAWMAGKPGHIHYSPLMEWRRSGGDLPADLADAVRSREFDAIVLDDRDEFKVDLIHSVDLGDLIRSNYVEDPAMAAWSGNDLIPVVGGKRRPKVFLIPRINQKEQG